MMLPQHTMMLLWTPSSSQPLRLSNHLQKFKVKISSKTKETESMYFSDNSLPVSVSELTNLNSLNSLNTPLVQEESLDPLRQLMTRKKDLSQ